MSDPLRRAANLTRAQLTKNVKRDTVLEGSL